MFLLKGLKMWEGKMRKFVILLCVICLCFCVADMVRAQEPVEEAIGYSGPASPEMAQHMAENAIVGFSFMPTSNLLVSQLGIFDDGLDGLTSSPTGGFLIGIFEEDGTYVVSSEITDMANPSGSPFLYAPVESSSDVILHANTLYHILANCGSDYYGFDTTDYDYFSPASVIGFSASAQYYLFPEDIFFPDLRGNLVLDDRFDRFNTDPTVSDGLFGPNFKYTAIPIPNAIWLLGSGLIGLVGLKRRRG